MSNLPPTGEGWRPIETAPNDGTPILTWGGRRTTVTLEPADGEYWTLNKHPDSATPTHWQPLPQPPAKER